MRHKAIDAEASGLREVQSKLRALKSAAEGLRSVGLWADTQTVESSNHAKLAVKRTGMAPAGGHSFWARQLASAEQEGFKYTASTSASELTVGGKTMSIAALATSVLTAKGSCGRRLRRWRRRTARRPAVT